MPCSLDTRTKNINAVISFKDIPTYNIKFDDLKNYLNSNTSEFAYILHDKDFNSDGEIKTKHVHLVAKFLKPMRLATVLNNLSQVLKINPFAVQIDKCTDFIASLQYLIHKNNTDKFQYSLTEITTNIESGIFDSYMNANNFKIDYDYLVSLCKSVEKKTDIMKILGLNLYENHYRAITELWNDYGLKV